MDEDDMKNSIDDAVSEGSMEVVEGADGKASYKLTDYGHVRAMELMATEALTIALTMIAKQALKEGKNPTVKEMADEAIKGFPNRLKREAKQNFAPFWHDFKDVTARQYIDTIDKADNA